MAEGIVMIVEDDLDLREAIVEVLELGGYSVMEARHGEEALRKLQKREQTPQLILLDLMMPVMDGFGFRRLQREDPDLSQIPVIVLTAHGNASELASELHAAACLNKPVEPDLLLQTVAKLLS